MYLLLRLEGQFCSLLGVSVAGAAAHNIGQVLAAIFWMQNSGQLRRICLPPAGDERPAWACDRPDFSVVLAHMKKIEFHV